MFQRNAQQRNRSKHLVGRRACTVEGVLQRQQEPKRFVRDKRPIRCSNCGYVGSRVWPEARILHGKPNGQSLQADVR